MSLRTRLLLGLSGAFLVFVVAAVVAVGAQRNELYRQVDAQLLGTPLSGDPVPGDPLSGEPPSGEPRPEPSDGPLAPGPTKSISELYLARLGADGELTVVVEGQLLADRPDIAALIAEAPTERILRTVSGEDGISNFRALYLPAPQPGVPISIVARPLDNVEATVRQLVYVFTGVAVVMALVLSLIAYWVNRFGITPITQMTNTAEAIAAGERERRAERRSATTEAGRLASAFNVMLDERDEAEDRLRHFVSNASHELRTPLTSIRGYLDLYAEGGFRQPGQMDDAVRRMQMESARMNLLVEDLLLLAKLDEQQALEIGPVDLASMLDDVAASALVAKPERSIHVTVNDAGRLLVQADAIRLQQAVAVLIDNALIHTPDDAAVRLSAKANEAAVTVVVSDDGPGIPTDSLEKVFDRFYRADASRSRDSGGSGLGLAIAKAIVEAHSGTITVESTVGYGTSFTIELPV
ncbi:MAG: sensor histidine kinase [Acidimicrobiales bacterium]